MEIKRFRASLKLMDDKAEEGTVQALFSVFNKRDEGDDVVLPTFFTDGQEVAMAGWGHNWATLPPGKGLIKVLSEGALFDGKFFMDTLNGQEHYKTIKHMGGLQEWSFGFGIKESRTGEFNDGIERPVRFLVRGETYEVSPVLIGMNRETGTLGIKSGLPYSEQSEAVLAAVQDLVARSKSLADLRAKEGRVLSEANRKRLSSLLGSLQAAVKDIEDLLKATAPSDDDKGAIERLFLEYQRTTAGLAGLGL